MLNDYGIRTLRFENKTVFTQQYIIVNSILKAQADFEAGGHTPPALCATSPNLGEDQPSSPSKLEGLVLELKQRIIDALNLEEMTPEDIETEAPLFGEGLGLDSIDALELIVLLEKNYGIRLANPAEGKEIFKSVASIAAYVNEHRTK